MLQQMLEEMGPLALAKAWGDIETNRFRDVEAYIARAGGVAKAQMSLSKATFYGNTAEDVLLGPLADGSWLSLGFHQVSWPESKLALSSGLYSYDPTRCNYYDDCTCDDGDLNEEEECPYCSNGSDYCTLHNEWH